MKKISVISHSTFSPKKLDGLKLLVGTEFPDAYIDYVDSKRIEIYVSIEKDLRSFVRQFTYLFPNLGLCF